MFSSSFTTALVATSLVRAAWGLQAQQALRVVSAHPIVATNPYTEWFRGGTATLPQVQDLVRQFSVFSQLFLMAQLRRCLEAPTKESMREAKEILANELGVVFRNSRKASDDIFSPEGSIEGGRFTHRAAHFEWLLDVGDAVGLGFDDLGKRKHGSAATLHFCDALYDIYGSEDLSTSLGASFAIEHWANAGFWNDLVDGFDRLNASGRLRTPTHFWRFHQSLEAQHAQHTMDELQEAIDRGLIADDRRFVDAANAMLDACAVFWHGLDESRRTLQPVHHR